MFKNQKRRRKKHKQRRKKNKTVYMTVQNIIILV